MINKDRTFFQYNSGDLVYITSPLTSQLCIASRKIMIKYVGPIVVYKIVDPHNYLLMTLDGKILHGIFEHERLKPTILRTSEGNVSNLVKLKQIINTGLMLTHYGIPYKHLHFSFPSDLKKTAVVVESLSNNTTNVLFQRIPAYFKI